MIQAPSLQRTINFPTSTKKAFHGLMGRTYDIRTKNYDHLIYHFLKSCKKEKIVTEFFLNLEEFHPTNRSAILRTAYRLTKANNKINNIKELREELNKLKMDGIIDSVKNIEFNESLELNKNQLIKTCLITVTFAISLFFLYQVNYTKKLEMTNELLDECINTLDRFRTNLSEIIGETAMKNEKMKKS